MCKPPWWFECYFRRSSWIHCWLLLAVLSDYFGQLVTSTFLLCKFRGLLGSIPVSFPVMWRWKCLGMKISFYSQVAQLPGTGWELSKRKRTWSRNAKSRKGLFHFKAEKGNKFEYCDNLWKQNIFHYPVRKLKACLENNSHAVCMEIFMFGCYFGLPFLLPIEDLFAHKDYKQALFEKWYKTVDENKIVMSWTMQDFSPCSVFVRAPLPLAR